MQTSRKEAYLRKHGVAPRRTSREIVKEMAPSESTSPRSVAEPPQQTWLQKRAQHVRARATGVPKPRNANDLDVAVTAVRFAAKLRTGPSWRERRKEVYLKTHSGKPEREIRVAATSVLFAAKLKLMRQRSLRGEGSTVSTMDAAPPASRRGTQELAWAQKRKHSVLKRHARQSKEQTKVAVASTAGDVAGARDSAAVSRVTPAESSLAVATPVDIW